MRRLLATVMSEVWYVLSPARRKEVRAEKERADQERRRANEQMFREINGKQRRMWDTINAVKQRAKESERQLLSAGETAEVVIQQILLQGGSYALLEEGVIVEDVDGRAWYVPPLTDGQKERWVRPGDHIKMIAQGEYIRAFLSVA